jgi:hypothetical protein
VGERGGEGMKGLIESISYGQVCEGVWHGVEWFVVSMTKCKVGEEGRKRVEFEVEIITQN